MYRKIAIATLLLGLFPIIASAQASCNGLSPAQCRMVAIVSTCHLGGTGHIVEEGRVTINGRLVGYVNNLGNIVDENGEMITELTKVYIQTCRNAN